MTGVPPMPMRPAKSTVGAAGLTDVGAGDRDDSGRGIRIVHEPERHRRRGVGRIERVNAVVVRGDEDDIANAEARNVESVDIQGLAVNLVVHGAFEELAELADVDVRRREHGLGEVGTGPGDVVVLGGDARLRKNGCGQQQRARKSQRPFPGRCFVKCRGLGGCMPADILRGHDKNRASRQTAPAPTRARVQAARARSASIRCAMRMAKASAAGKD